MEGISRIIYGIVWTLVMLGGISWTLLTIKDYSENLSTRETMKMTLTNKWAGNCMSSEVAKERGMEGECKDIALKLAESPRLYALFDVAQRWGICEMLGCKMLLERYSMQLICVCLAIVVMWIMFGTYGMPRSRQVHNVIPSTFDEADVCNDTHHSGLTRRSSSKM